MKKFLCLMLALVLALSACGTPGGKREQVTVALWSDQLTERYTAYLQERFPQVDFTFYVATNSTDFYRFKLEQDDLPDILTVRRFALRDVAGWKDALLDVSATDLVSAFPQSYLRSYTYSDGTVNWLPTCAEIDSIVMNRALLEELGVDVPTDYESFREACRALSQKGVRPFLSNFSADYTCMEILQGLSIQQLTSQAGREWRQQYESGAADQLSEEVWMPVFEKMEAFLEDTGITEPDLALSHTDILAAFESGQVAMMRGTGNEEAIRKSQDGEYQLMPYFGQTPEDGWYLTYPAFQVAASKKGTDDPARRELILEILDAMLGQEGQEHIAGGKNMIPYSDGVELPLSPELENMQPYIDRNQLYIRLASSDMFQASQEVVQGMISGKYPDARSAFDAFNLWLNVESADTSGLYPSVETGYPYAFDPEHGSRAASAIMNSLREEAGTQLLIGPAAAVAGNITPGSYSLEEVGFLTMGESPEVILCEMTGEQLFRFVEYLLTAPDRRGSVCNDSTLYVSSGFEMQVKKAEGGYELEGLTQNGQELDRDATYSVAALGHLTMMLEDALDAAGVGEYSRTERAYKMMILDRLARGDALAEPTDYITLR